MNITLSRTPGWLKITFFGPCAPQVEAEIIRRLATVGALGSGRRWFAPLARLQTLVDLFPKASYEYEAFCAFDAANAVIYPQKAETLDFAARNRPTDESDRQLSLLFDGIQNAKRRAEANEYKYPKRRRSAPKREP